MTTVTRAEFLKDAAGILRRSETEGPIGITGEDGKIGAIVHSPRDERPVLDEAPNGVLAELRTVVQIARWLLTCTAPIYSTSAAWIRLRAALDALDKAAK
jgi:hypothetical protein